MYLSIYLQQPLLLHVSNKWLLYKQTKPYMHAIVLSFLQVPKGKRLG